MRCKYIVFFLLASSCLTTINVSGNKFTVNTLLAEPLIIDLEYVPSEKKLFAATLNGVYIIDTESFSYRRLDTLDGLFEGSMVTSLEYDSSRNLLYIGEDSIGSDGKCGVSIYDAKKNIISHIPELNNTRVRCLLYVKHLNVLFIGTIWKGLLKYDFNNNTLKKYSFSEGLTDNSIYDMTLDEINSLIYITSFDWATFTLFNFKENVFKKIGNPILLSNNKTTYLYCAFIDKLLNKTYYYGNDGIYLANSEYIKVFNGYFSIKNIVISNEKIILWNGDKIYITNNSIFNPKEILLDKYYSSRLICFNKDKNELYVALNWSFAGGLYRYNFSNNSMEKIILGDGLSRGDCYFLNFDIISNTLLSSNYWYREEDGLVRLSKYNNIDNKFDVSNDVCKNISITKYLANYKNYTLLKNWKCGTLLYDNIYNKIYYIKIDNDIVNKIRDIAIDEKNKKIFFGLSYYSNIGNLSIIDLNTRELRVKTTNNGLISDFIYKLYLDEISNILYIGTKEGLSIYDVKLDNFKNILNGIQIRDIILDNTLNILFIGTNKGLYSYDISKQNIISQKNINNGLSNNDIYTLNYDYDDKLLFIGTSGNGLNIYDVNNNFITQFTENNGLVSNYIESLAYDKINTKLYIGTYDCGITIINTELIKFSYYENLYNLKYSTIYMKYNSSIIFDNPIAKSLVQNAQDSLNKANQLAQSEKWDEAIVQLNNTSNYLDQASTTQDNYLRQQTQHQQAQQEQIQQQQTRNTLLAILSVITLITIIIIFNHSRSYSHQNVGCF